MRIPYSSSTFAVASSAVADVAKIPATAVRRPGRVCSGTPTSKQITSIGNR